MCVAFVVTAMRGLAGNTTSIGLKNWYGKGGINNAKIINNNGRTACGQ